MDGWMNSLPYLTHTCPLPAMAALPLGSPHALKCPTLGRTNKTRRAKVQRRGPKLTKPYTKVQLSTFGSWVRPLEGFYQLWLLMFR